MFRNILVPTDGSKLSAKAIRHATRLARLCGARLTAVYVAAPWVPPIYGEAAVYVPEITAKRYKEIAGREAKKALAAVESDSRAAGVDCSGVTVSDEQPWKGILKTAKAKKCDAIVMASHGRRGIAGLLLGSETTKVLTHSKLPVLVVR